jgi:hypothetical protein
MKYKVYDTVGKFIKSFPTKREALNYLTAMSRWDWAIKKEG